MPVLCENEKVFDHYNELPPELRMMVVDEMEPNDRCRFTRCSKLSKKDGLSSKNYHYAIFFVYYYYGLIEIEYQHCKGEGETYTVTFFEEDEKNMWKCVDRDNEEFWREELDSSVDLTQHALEYFKNVLKLHQNKIKDLILALSGSELQNYDFGIRKLNRLEYLMIDSDVDVEGYLSKTPRLRVLSVCDYGNHRIPANLEKVYQISGSVHMEFLKLNNEQFLQLSAASVTISIGYLTEFDIYNFIRSWQNGTVGKKVKWFGWHLKESNFDKDKLFRLLGLSYDVDEGQNPLKINLKHNKDNEKRAELSYWENRFQQLSFRVWGEY